MDGDKITMRLETGKMATVELSAFCEKDRQFVKTWEADLLERDWNVFGYERPSGNELDVTFYDLKVKKDGKFTKGGEYLYEEDMSPSRSGDYEKIMGEFWKMVGRFSSRSWVQSDFEEYYKAPQVRYASAVMYLRLPPILDHGTGTRRFHLKFTDPWSKIGGRRTFFMLIDSE